MFPAEVSIQAFFDSVIIFLNEQASKLGSQETVHQLASLCEDDLDLVSVNLIIADATTTDLAADLLNLRLDELKRDGLDARAREAIQSYEFGHLPEANQFEEVDRSRSGRPRTKRPKL